MTPGARIAAAIEILDQIYSGLATEQALTRWARGSRYAGSKDRAAVRDHVYDVQRRRRSLAYLGQGETGRALMIGLARHQGWPLETLFNGEGHAPTALTSQEEVAPQSPAAEQAVRWNLPDWLVQEFESSLGEAASDAAQALQDRAPTTLRVNTARMDVAAAIELLGEDGVIVERNPQAPGALTLTDGPRRLRNSRAYLDGLVELQDAASQAMVARLPDAARVLDYCAGGGGKALAIAMRPGVEVFAHDIDPARMADLPDRAARAQVEITALSAAEVTQHAPYDLVLCDAPCSGSGTWRRAPDAKWHFTPDRLAELTRLQQDILRRAAGLTAPDGALVYATCSVLRQENEICIGTFLDNTPGWGCELQQHWPISTENDGFFVAHLTREQIAY